MKKSTEPYLARYLHGKGYQMGLPIGGTFELTPRCNFNCPMCYVHLSQKDQEAAGKELTAQQWIDLAREARDQGMMFVLLTGGEPFIRKDFFEIYHAIKQMGLMVSINSNGSMLDGEIRRKLLEDPPFRINISLYGGCAQTYRDMCGQDVFSRVVDNIRALREGGVDVRLNLSITPHNRQDIEKIHKIATELDVHVKATSYMYPPIRIDGVYGGGKRLNALEAAQSAVEWDTLRFTPEEFSQRASGMNQIRNTEHSECAMDLDEGVGCRAGSTSFWMTWDGRMLPCGMMPGPCAEPLKDGFAASWAYIREETKKIRMPRECTACPNRKACSVCAAVCVTETGAFDRVPEYVCRLTEHTLEETWRVEQERRGRKDEN